MKRVVFTNGCFDIIHAGHIDLLERAKMLGDYLIVGINGDESVKNIKGNDRPFMNEIERKTVLLGLKAVNEVHIFNELTPENLIKQIKPDVLVKGGDWKKNEIIGANFVEENGGKVFSLPLKAGYSSSKIVEKIRNNKLSKIDTSFISGDENPSNMLKYSLGQHIEIFETILREQFSKIEDCAEIIHNTLEKGNKLLLLSDSDVIPETKFLASEIQRRLEIKNKDLRRIKFIENASNFKTFEDSNETASEISDETELLPVEGDCMLTISTSGNEQDTINAVMNARNLKCSVVSITSAKGKKLASLSDACVLIPTEDTERFREASLIIGKNLAKLI